MSEGANAGPSHNGQDRPKGCTRPGGAAARGHGLASKGGRGTGKNARAHPCEGITIKGEPCAAAALPGSTFCLFHDPERATERAEARRAGGVERSRRMAVLPEERPEPPLETVSDVTRLLGSTIWDLLKGRVDPRIANTVGYLAATMIRGIEAAELEQRLAALEGIVAAQEADPGSAFERPLSGRRIDADADDEEVEEEVGPTRGESR